VIDFNVPSYFRRISSSSKKFDLNQFPAINISPRTDHQPLNTINDSQNMTRTFCDSSTLLLLLESKVTMTPDGAAGLSSPSSLDAHQRALVRLKGY
jgi:hypothetical protein